MSRYERHTVTLDVYPADLLRDHGVGPPLLDTDHPFEGAVYATTGLAYSTLGPHHAGQPVPLTGAEWAALLDSDVEPTTAETVEVVTGAGGVFLPRESRVVYTTAWYWDVEQDLLYEPARVLLRPPSDDRDSAYAFSVHGQPERPATVLSKSEATERLADGRLVELRRIG